MKFPFYVRNIHAEQKDSHVHFLLVLKCHLTLLSRFLTSLWDSFLLQKNIFELWTVKKRTIEALVLPIEAIATRISCVRDVVSNKVGEHQHNLYLSTFSSSLLSG